MPVFFGLLILLPAVWTFWFYNRLVIDRNRTAEAWSGIEVQLKRRHDLIPRLVEVVKGYASHEKATLTAVTDLRNRAAASEDPSLEQKLTETIRPLLLLSEDYPELKAAVNFRQLSEQLVEVEDTLQMARRYYNGCVRNYNNRVEGFPGILLAGIFSAAPKSFFEVESATERLSPHVEL